MLCCSFCKSIFNTCWHKWLPHLFPCEHTYAFVYEWHFIVFRNHKSVRCIIKTYDWSITLNKACFNATAEKWLWTRVIKSQTHASCWQSQSSNTKQITNEKSSGADLLTEHEIPDQPCGIKLVKIFSAHSEMSSW